MPTAGLPKARPVLRSSQGRVVYFVLIESLAEAIAEMVLRETGASKAKIRLTKCHPPIPELTGRVTVEIVRP